eukprot:COSAG05_NODE_9534_length_618_cov_0.612717_1_plen_87_part_01
MRRQAGEDEQQFAVRLQDETERTNLAAMEAQLYAEEGETLAAALERSAEERIAGRRGVLDGVRPRRRPQTPKVYGRPTPSPSALLAS